MHRQCCAIGDGILRVAIPAAFRLQLAYYDRASYGFNIVPLAISWTKKAFGTFEVKCFKGAPESAPLASSWDASMLNVSEAELGELCMKAGRAAFGPLESVIGSPLSDKVNKIYGPQEASLAIFWKEWAFLANSWGDLIIAVPDDNTILFSRGDHVNAVGLLHDAAQAIVDSETPSPTRLTSDVYRWTKDGWQSAH